jgi:hypothetical protein
LVIVGRFLGIHDAPKWDEWHGSPAAKLDGRLVTFREGSREVRIAGKPHAISAAIRIVENRVMAPLSLIEYVTQKRFTWTVQDGVPVGALR